MEASKNERRSNEPDEALRAKVRAELESDSERSDRAIGRACGCSHAVVAMVRQQLFGGNAGRNIRGGYVMGEHGETIRTDEFVLDEAGKLFAALDRLMLHDLLRETVRSIHHFLCEPKDYDCSAYICNRLKQAAELARLLDGMNYLNRIGQLKQE